MGGLPGQISSGLIQDMLNKSYGAAFQLAPSQAITGMGGAASSLAGTQNAMISGQSMMNAAQIQANAAANAGKGSGLGGIGMGVGSMIGGKLSDRRTKDNIRALDIVNGLNPVLFDYLPEYCTPGQVGFMADEIEKVAPGMVSTGEDGLKRIDPYAFIPLLVSAIKEQQQVIDELRDRS